MNREASRHARHVRRAGSGALADAGEGWSKPVSDSESMRLQKYLARSGVASRRGSEALVAAGRVRVNGRVVTEMGVCVNPSVDVVEADGVVVRPDAPRVTLMLHKPLGYVTTMKDEHAKHIVSELVPTERYAGLFPLGRLDRDTSGLLLFSTDGDLGHAVLRPRGHVTKQYLALVEGEPTAAETDALRRGVMLDDGMTLPARVDVLRGVPEERARRQLELPLPQEKKERHAAARQMGRACTTRDSARDAQAGSGTRDLRDSHGQRGTRAASASPARADISRQYERARVARAASCTVVRIGIHEGRNRQVRRMFAAIGHPVVALHRESFGPLELGSLPRGEWRLLTEAETAALGAAVAGEQC